MCQVDINELFRGAWSFCVLKRKQSKNKKMKTKRNTEKRDGRNLPKPDSSTEIDFYKNLTLLSSKSVQLMKVR